MSTTEPESNDDDFLDFLDFFRSCVPKYGDMYSPMYLYVTLPNIVRREDIVHPLP